MIDVTDKFHALAAEKTRVQPARSTTSSTAGTTTASFFTFEPPSYFADFELPPDSILAGDCHLTRGDVVVIGGVPGCGKSRLLVSLAIAGKQGKGADWMGLPIHAGFKTAIMQAENGEVRLKRELEDIAQQGHELDGWLHITPPPRFGLAFNDPNFRAQLRDWLATHKPGVFAIDPWNRCTQDDKAKDYRAILDNLYEVLPEGKDKPVIVIVHHLRKQASGEARKRGRDLLNELSGSYVIGSACRVAFILEPATPDGADNRVIFTCAKNNNGEMGSPSAWHRMNGLFEPCRGFDWQEWEGDGRQKRASVELADLAAIFENGARVISRSDAVKAVQGRCGVKQSAAYEAFKVDGRFSAHLSDTGGFVTFRP